MKSKKNALTKIKMEALAEIGFEASLKDPMGWLMKSLSLMKASLEIRDKSKEESGLLAGYAFEILLKSYLIAEGNFSGRQLPPLLKGHDLPFLRSKISSLGRAKEGDTKTLKTLHEYVLWKGRYPIPLSSEWMFGAKEIDFQRCDELWKRYLSSKPLKLSQEIDLLVEFMEKV